MTQSGQNYVQRATCGIFYIVRILYCTNSRLNRFGSAAEACVAGTDTDAYIAFHIVVTLLFNHLASLR